MGRPFVCFAAEDSAPPPITLPSEQQLVTEEGFNDDRYNSSWEVDLHETRVYNSSWEVDLHETRVDLREAADALWTTKQENEEEEDGAVYRFRIMSPEACSILVTPEFTREVSRATPGVALEALRLGVSVAAAIAANSSCFTVCLEVLYPYGY